MCFACCRKFSIWALALLVVSSGFSRADTLVSGTISVNTTWTLANSPYVVTGDVTVEGTSTPVLTIQPGVIVKFNAATRLVIGNSYPGELQAVGTSTQLITLTANTASPTAGFWHGLWLSYRTTSTSQLAYATIQYAGWVNNQAALEISSSPTVQNVAVLDNVHSGVSASNGGSPSLSGLDVERSSIGVSFWNGGSASLSNSTISNNTTGIMLWGPAASTPSLSVVAITGNSGFAISQEAHHTFTAATQVTATGNGTNGVEVRASTTDLSATWKNLVLPYVVTGDVTVEKYGAPVPVLTISAGVTIKFNANTRLVVGNSYPGELQAVGTSPSRITLTANGSTTPGFWHGIWLAPNTTSTSRLTYATIQYAGWLNNQAALEISSSPTVQNVTVLDNVHSGVSASNGGSPSLSGLDVERSSIGVSFWNGGSASLSNSTISNNTTGIMLWGPAASTPSLSVVAITGNSGFAISQEAHHTFTAATQVTATGNGTNGVEVRASTTDISATWKNLAFTYVVTGDVYVQKNGTPVPVLTVAAGVTVKFNAGRSLIIGNSYPGELQAVGTSALPITFTANTPTPYAGFWTGIRFMPQATSASRIVYATVSYGGTTNFVYWGGIHVQGPSPTLQNLTLQNNLYAGISLGTPSAPALQTVACISNSGACISQDAKITLAAATGVTATGNAMNGIEIRTGTVDVNTTWRNANVPYFVTGIVSVSGAATPVLTLPPGLTLKFNSGTALTIGGAAPGNLSAIGTQASPILFTANTVTPAAGFWRGILINANTSATTKISYATVSYGGVGGTYGGVHVAGATPTLDHVHFDTNTYSGLSVNGAVPIVLNCDFIGNLAGLVNQTPAIVVDARLNWWNALSGPSGSGPGTGQSVSAGARFEPWLATATTDPQSVRSFLLKNSTSNPAIGINAVFTFTTSLSGNWSLSILNGSGATIRTFAGTGTTGTATWDGKNDSGIAQPDGAYTYQVASAVGTQNAAPARGSASLDRTKQLLITGIAVAPAYFSPNSDGIQDATSLTAVSTFDGATWTVRVKNAGGAVLQTATGPAAPNIAYTWDGRNSTGTLQPEAIYTLELTLVDEAASVVSTPTATLDLTFPTATMTAPAVGAVLSNIYQSGSTDVSVTGTGTDLNLLNWTVDFGSGTSPSSWTSVATGTTLVSAAQFASWATLGLTNGTYTLRLQVWDRAGNRSFVTRTESVGNFLVSGGSQTLYLAGAGTASFTSVVPFIVTETVVVLNGQSQTTATLFNGQRNAGTYIDSWNGHDSLNALVPDGNYTVIATAVSGSSSMTWNPGPAAISDSTPFVGYVHNGWITNPPADFWPFNNKPFIGTYTFTNGTPPRPGRVWALFTPNKDSVYFYNTARISMCSVPGNFCSPAGEYQWPGTHTISWLGIDPSGNIRQDISALVVMVTGETAGGNVVQVYGTRPAVTNVVIAPTYYRPGSGPLQITLNAATYQGRTVNASATFERLGVSGPLQTVTLTGQSPGAVTLSWDGRSSTGLLVGPGNYLVTVTVTDSAGAQTVQQSLMTINY